MIVPYIAHNNGVVKKKNKTILEKVRNMAIEKNYPIYLWNGQVTLPSIWLIYVHQEWMEDCHLSSCTLKCLQNLIIWEPLDV